jgi:hypothetical protein
VEELVHHVTAASVEYERFVADGSHEEIDAAEEALEQLVYEARGLLRVETSDPNELVALLAAQRSHDPASRAARMTLSTILDALGADRATGDEVQDARWLVAEETRRTAGRDQQLEQMRRISAEIETVGRRIAMSDRRNAETDVVVATLEAAAAQLRDLPFVGTVPIVLDGELEALEASTRTAVLTLLTKLAKQHQVIVVSDDSSVAAWASSLGRTSGALAPQALRSTTWDQ